MGAWTANAHTTGSRSQAAGEIAGILTSPGGTAPGLGPIDTWPTALRTIVELILAARVPMALVWGRDATLLYNDAYALVLGTRHPSHLGRPLGEALGQVDSSAAPPDYQRMISAFCSSIEPEAGAPADFSCSPIRDESGNVAGALAIFTQTAPHASREDERSKDATLRSAQHRLKNTLQLVASLMNLQANQLEGSREFAPFEEARNRVHCIAAVHDFLYTSQQHETVDIFGLARRLAPELASFYDCGERVHVGVEGDTATLEVERAVPFALLLHELVSNACKHAFPARSRGEVSIRVEPEGEDRLLAVADTGVGLPSGLNYESGASLGLRLIRMFVRQLGGQLQTLPGPGARVEVRFPASLAVEEDSL